MVAGFFDDLGGGFAGAMAGAGFDPDQDRRGAGLGGLHGGGVFEAVTGEDAVVMIGGDDERRRIFRPRFHVVERRIFVDRLEFILVLGRAVIGGPGPADGEFLEPEHVHHADARQGCAPKIRPLIFHRADKQTAVAPAADRELRRGRVFVREAIRPQR